MLNGGHLIWPPPLADLGLRGRLAHLTRRDTVQGLLHDPAARQAALDRVRQSGRVLRGRLVDAAGGAAGPRDPVTAEQVLTALVARGVQVTVAASPGEPALQDLIGLPPDAGVRVRRLSGPVGAHTLATAGLHAQALETLDDALADLRSRLRA